jgi:hypothetical protein
MEMNMRFEESLYMAMSDVYPDISVRSFSRVLGKSEGYWSSITAQQLSISNAALIHLNDYLNCKRLLLESDSPKAVKIDLIQDLIAQEIVSRFAFQNEDFDKVWKEMAKEIKQDPRGWVAMPFVMRCGY